MSDPSMMARQTILARLAAVLCGPWGVAVLVFGVTAARLALLSSDLAPPVIPSEAGVWALGQVSRPLWPEIGPLLPWLLGLLSGTCGADAPCLRLLGPVAHGAAMWFLYRLGSRLFDNATGFWCALLYGTLPLVLQGGLVIGPMALVMPLWTLALLALLQSSRMRDLLNWIVLGMCVGAGLLVHPVMALFVPLAVLYLMTSPHHVGLWRRSGPYVASLVGLLCLLPELLHAAGDQWTGAHRLIDSLTAPRGDPWALSLTVVLWLVLAGPVLAGALAYLLLRTPAMLRVGAWADYRVRLLLLFSVPVLAGTLFLTTVLDDGVMLMAPAVPAVLAMVCGWLLIQGRAGWLIAALVLNVAVSAALLVGPESARRAGWVLPPVLDAAAPGRGFEGVGRWLETLASAYPDVPLGVAGADAPLLAYHAAVRGVTLRMLGTGPREDGTQAFQGLLVMPAALADASAGAGSDIRARLTVTLPDGRVLAWAAALVP